MAVLNSFPPSGDSQRVLLHFLIRRHLMGNTRESPAAFEEARAEYLFIDNARFLSMIAIVARHCELSLYDWSPAPLLESVIVQFRTFGVQLFFVVSAFLMLDWLARHDFDVRGYWRSRIRHVAIPWLIWVGIYIALDLVRFFTIPQKRPIGLGEEIFGDIFYQAYWYVPILLLSLAVLLLLRRYWESWRFGLVLLLLSLIYGVNQYTLWFPSAHTIAVFGYLFPAWVGVRLFQNFRAVSAWIVRLPWWLLIVLLSLSFSLTIGEDRLFESLGFPDTYNALQISNQFYSLVFLLVLLKLPIRLVPSFIDVRKDTYGIYLTHQIIALVGRGTINLVAGRNAEGKSLFVQLPTLIQDPAARVGLWFLWTVVVYVIALLTVKLLRRSPLAWIVGVKGPSLSAMRVRTDGGTDKISQVVATRDGLTVQDALPRERT